jgi:hypothetical protein
LPCLEAQKITLRVIELLPFTPLHHLLHYNCSYQEWLFLFLSFFPSWEGIKEKNPKRTAKINKQREGWIFGRNVRSANSHSWLRMHESFFLYHLLFLFLSNDLVFHFRDVEAEGSDCTDLRLCHLPREPLDLLGKRSHMHCSCIFVWQERRTFSIRKQWSLSSFLSFHVSLSRLPWLSFKLLHLFYRLRDDSHEQEWRNHHDLRCLFQHDSFTRR